MRLRRRCSILTRRPLTSMSHAAAVDHDTPFLHSLHAASMLCEVITGRASAPRRCAALRFQAVIVSELLLVLTLFCSYPRCNNQFFRLRFNTHIICIIIINTITTICDSITSITSTTTTITSIATITTTLFYISHCFKCSLRLWQRADFGGAVSCDVTSARGSQLHRLRLRSVLLLRCWR